MGNLFTDIETIASFATIESAPSRICFGKVENAHGKTIDIVIGTDYKWDLFLKLEEMFSDCDRTSRIAVVYQDQGDVTYCGAWTQAARDFGSSDIAGVFILEGTSFMNTIRHRLPFDSPRISKTKDNVVTATVERVGSKMETVVFSCDPFKDEDLFEDALVERLVLSHVPDTFRSNDFPIVFDEHEIMESFMPNISKLDLDPHISFPTYREADRSSLVFASSWCDGHFPLCHANGTVREADATRAAGAKMLSKADYECRTLFLKKTRNFISRIDSVSSMIDVANELSPESIDEKRLFATGAFCGEWFGKRSYALAIDENDAMKTTGEESEKLIGICRIIGSALGNATVRWNGDDAEITARLAEACREAGAEHQINAFLEGVPLEDVLA